MDGKDKKPSADDGAEPAWHYKPKSSEAVVTKEFEVPSTASTPAGYPGGSVEWTASEFVAHEKGFEWYALLGVGTIVVAAGLYLVTRDIFAVVVVVIMATVFGIAANHKPRTVAYKLDSSGLTAGNKFYPYKDYKSFSLPEDGPFISIELAPMKRFGFPASAYLAPDSQDEVLDLLSNHLPMERGEVGSVDKLMRHLRF